MAASLSFAHQSHVLSCLQVQSMFFVFACCLFLRYEYLWADGKNIKKPIKVSAPEYADYLMTWVQQTLEDEETFPVSDGTNFDNLI